MDLARGYGVRRDLPASSSCGEGKSSPRLSAQKNRTLRSCLLIITRGTTSIVAAVEAGIVVMVVVMITTISGHHDDPRAIPLIAISAILAVVMVMMVVVIELGKLDIFVRRRSRPGFMDRLQQRSSVRDRLQPVCEGIGPQDVGRGRTWNRRGFGAGECSERRYRSQKSSDLLFHTLSPRVTFAGCITRWWQTRPLRNGSRDSLAMMSDR